MAEMKEKAVVTLGTMHFREANEEVRAALAHTDVVEVRDAYAQRYLGCGMPRGKRLEIHGVPGNDLACYMDGGSVEVFGNAQDQVANTMNDGEIVVHGRVGDAAGYGMRGGRLLVRDNCGWRVGIHMKQYKDKHPTIVIGGNSGSFLGEYMAGGTILLLGRPGPYLARGMHGGVIYLKHVLDVRDMPDGVVQTPVNDEDRAVIARLLGAYNAAFAQDLGEMQDTSGEGFYALRPASSRPYASMYANN
jgi:glutamate synthase domain-containing protein 3